MYVFCLFLFLSTVRLFVEPVVSQYNPLPLNRWLWIKNGIPVWTPKKVYFPQLARPYHELASSRRQPAGGMIKSLKCPCFLFQYITNVVGSCLYVEINLIMSFNHVKEQIWLAMYVYIDTHLIMCVLPCLSNRNWLVMYVYNIHMYIHIIYNVIVHVNEFGLLYDVMCIYKYL